MEKECVHLFAFFSGYWNYDLFLDIWRCFISFNIKWNNSWQYNTIDNSQKIKRWINKNSKGNNKKRQKNYVCEACNMAYLDRNLAKKCEDWCNKYKSCNLEIIKHAV